jgi:hypothetical protein
MGRDAHGGGPRRTLGDRQLLEERWRAIGVDGRIITCSIYRLDGPGFEVRVGYASGDYRRIRHVTNRAEAGELAEEWRRLVLGQGLTELSIQPVRSARS